LNVLLVKGSFLLWAGVVHIPITGIALLNLQFAESVALRLIEEARAQIPCFGWARIPRCWWILGIIRPVIITLESKIGNIFGLWLVYGWLGQWR
jgi:hypothetical protein